MFVTTIHNYQNLKATKKVSEAENTGNKEFNAKVNEIQAMKDL